jgi:hypothetical protein
MRPQGDKYNPRCNARSPTGAYLRAVGHPSSEPLVTTLGNGPKNTFDILCFFPTPWPLFPAGAL